MNFNIVNQLFHLLNDIRLISISELQVDDFFYS